MESIREWALYYASIGWAVFPLKPRSKQPATAQGFKNATKDPAQIERWWHDNPDYNIGIATGTVSGIVVIDLDKKEEKGIDGYDTILGWQQDNGPLPETCTSITGGGGYHMIYRDTAINQSKVGLYEGVDIRGDGGYIVAPPSIHPNGRPYQWETEPDEIASVDMNVITFLIGPVKPLKTKAVALPEIIPEGGRVTALVKLVGSLKAKGLSDVAITAAVSAENESKCVPPLTDQELQREVIPSISRNWEAERPYSASKNKYTIPADTSLYSLDDIQEESPEWLVSGYIPRYQITVIAGDGGSGKTTVWCAIAAAISRGNTTFLESFLPEDWGKGEPRNVIFFSSEDDIRYTLKRKLRKNGADFKYIHGLTAADDRISNVKFNSEYLKQILEKYRPALCVFDPLQAFVPENIKMGERNAMRQNMAALIGYGSNYGTTSLIIMHSNKQAGVWGRKRMADSSDVWDISRSVLMAGETNVKGINYLSHEKSNYGVPGKTVLYSLNDDVVEFKGYTDKKDMDYVTARDNSSRQRPEKDSAKDAILESLADGTEKELSDLEDELKACGSTTNAIKNAKAELKKEGRIKIFSRGVQPKKWYAVLRGMKNPSSSENI